MNGLARVAVGMLGLLLVTAVRAAYPQIYAGDSAAGVIYHDVPAGQATTVGDLTICLDRAGTVTIERVESREAFGGLQLEQYGALPMNDPKLLGFTDKHAPIADLVPGFTQARHLEGTCPDMSGSTTASPSAKPYLLLLQYTRPTDQSAGNSGIVIWYRSAGAVRSIFVDWWILLCDPQDKATPRCQGT